MHTETYQSTPSAEVSSGGRVRLEFLENGLAILYLGTPGEKVVTLTAERMSSLRDELQRLRQQKPLGLVIAGAHTQMFTAGADINIIREVKDVAHGESLAREGQSLFDEIEALPFRTVAAISGPCVGGGCELVLACKYRVISDDKSSSIGLPETKLGILPGFGGTQRLPRLIGLPKALDIILAGKILKPKQALKAGLVDQIAKNESVLEKACAIASGEYIPKRRGPGLFERLATNNSVLRTIVKNKALKALLKQTKGFYPAPPAALDSVIYGLKNGMKLGLAYEAKGLGKLIITPECKSLVNVFFLTEAAKGLGKSGKKAVENLSALVIGAGAMGAGIAGVLAKNDGSVILKDTTDAAVKRGVDQIKSYLESMKYISESERSFVLNRVEGTTKPSSNAANANFVIEAIFEDLALKTSVLGEASALVGPECIIASNTSSLSITKIAEGLPQPERVAGMHFFNPVEKMPLVEIIRGKKTADKTVAVLAALTVKIGKYPIIVEDVPGFLVNRILSPYLNEAGFLLQEGYSIEDIDRAATSFGMPMGPLRLLDEVGLDVAAHVSEIMLQGYGTRMKGNNYARVLVDAGRKGKKSGAGFYEFKDGKPTPTLSIREILKISAAPKQASGDYLTKRLVMHLVNEGVKCLDEGVAGKPGRDAANQVDLGTVMGIGFPPFRGGLLNYASALGAKSILETLTEFEKQFGERYAVAPGITKRATSNRSFYEA